MVQSAKRILPALLALFAGALAVLPAIVFGIPRNNDLLIHYHYAIPFYDALSHGHWYPGWLATLNAGYGDDIVRFYPPAMYYLLAAGRRITGDWQAGTLAAVTCLSALGSLGAYFWARSFVSANLAVWAALFYALMPYHLAEFYQAAQLAEFFAGAALLFALAFTQRICDRRGWFDVAGLAASYAALMLTHLPLAFFGSMTLLLYALINLSVSLAREGSSLKEWMAMSCDKVLKLAVAVALGLGASSFYWVTMVSELKWIIGDGANPDKMVNYRYNFVFSSFAADKEETIWWMGLLATATILMAIPALYAIVRDKKMRRPLVGVLAVFVFAFVMSTVLSKPLWMLIPYLEKTQHPFRWLAVVSTAAPILMAASVPFWRAQLRGRKRSLAFAMSGLVLIAITFSISQTVRGATYLSGVAFKQMLEPLGQAGGVIQWLPVWARASAADRPTYERCIPPVDGAKVEASNREIQITEWSDLQRRFQVGPGAAGAARVATFYYPHWQATVNGQSLQTSAAPDGALMVPLPEQSATVVLEFREPPRTKLADGLSIISWTFVASLLIFGKFATARHEPIAN